MKAQSCVFEGTISPTSPQEHAGQRLPTLPSLCSQFPTRLCGHAALSRCPPGQGEGLRGMKAGREPTGPLRPNQL